MENMAFVSPTAGETSRALEAREQELREAAEQRRLKQDNEAASQKRGHGDIRSRDDELAFLSEKRRLARFENPTMAGKVKRNLKMSQYMLMLYPHLSMAAHVHGQYKETKSKVLEWTQEELEDLDEKALLMPESQSGEAEELYYQSIAVNCPPSDYLQPPLAPDGYVPNSVIWQQMREYGGEPGVGGMPLDWKPAGMTDEQRRAQEVEEEEDSDDGDGQFMDNALGEEEEEEIEEEEEEEVEVVKHVSKRAAKTSFLVPEKPKPAPKFKKIEKKEPTPPPTPPRTPTPELAKPVTPPPTKPKTPPPEKWPPLPRYIGMFRSVAWFELKFPRAVPKKFDFLRPYGPVDGEQRFCMFCWLCFGSLLQVVLCVASEECLLGPSTRAAFCSSAPPTHFHQRSSPIAHSHLRFIFIYIHLMTTGVHPQVELSTWIDYLCSLDYETNSSGISIAGVGRVRKGLLWKARDALIGELGVDAVGLARSAVLVLNQQHLPLPALGLEMLAVGSYSVIVVNLLLPEVCSGNMLLR
jgi:hypothetical protein